MLRGRSRRNVAFLALAMLLGVTAVALAGPSGSFVDGTGTQKAHGIVKYGPINPENGFPDWYRDAKGNEVEPCLQAADPNCNAPEVPDPAQPTTFPDNFPGEFFYWTGEAALTANGGNAVLAEYALEGTFAAELPRFPDQMVFTRTRYRVRGGLQPDTDYTITNPYGVDVVHTDPGSTELFVTEDIGAAAGAFGDVFNGQVGPLLKWTGPDAPAGYLGDPATPHEVTGSPYETNFVKIEGPGVGGANNPNPCPGFNADTSPDCIYTELFSIMGKKSTKGGVEVARATYSRESETAKPQLDVIAESKADQDIVVQDTIVGTGRRFQITPLTREDGRYYTHLDVQGDLPPKVDVVNRSDVPQTVKHVTVTDQVTGTAVYDTDTGELHVTAASSDQTMPATDLTVAGFDTPLEADGAVDITTTVPPNTVKVDSKGLGSAEIPVQIQGSGSAPLALAALAGADQTVEQGAKVTLDGAASTGNIDSYAWSGPADITLTGADTPKATFTAPSTPGDYEFTLKVTGPDGTPPAVTSKEDTVVVHVKPVSDVEAKIAFANAVTSPTTAITVPQNLPVTLDGGQSVGAAAFSWEQVSGPGVDLGTTDQSSLTFTFPKTDQDVVLRLTVRNPTAVATGECTDTSCGSVEVTLSPEPDELATTKARFVPDGSRWVIDGTATSTKSNKVTVYSGRTLSAAMKIGTSDVLADGTWSVDVRDSTVPTTTCFCVTAVSDRGGTIEAALEKADRLPATTVDPGPAPTAPLAAAGTAAPLAAAVPLAGARLAAAPVTGGALAARAVAAPATITAASIATTGVPVTVNVPAGATLVRLRVLTSAGTPLLSTFKKVKGGAKVKVRIRSAKLRRNVRAGKRLVVEVRTGTAKNRLGKAVRKTVRVR